MRQQADLAIALRNVRYRRSALGNDSVSGTHIDYVA
jgi:hypothetical protein